MNSMKNITFIDNKAALAKPDHYVEIIADIPGILESWKSSLYSFEWLDPEGKIKDLDALSESEQTKRCKVEEALKTGEPLEKPLLGIGLQDNVEIGSGRATLLTLAAQGQTAIPVHIPKSCESDFKPFQVSL